MTGLLPGIDPGFTKAPVLFNYLPEPYILFTDIIFIFHQSFMSPTRRRKSNNARTLVWFVAAFLTVLLVALGVYFWYAKTKLHGDLKGIEVSYAKYPVRGIDVSHFTGKIDFNAIDEEGVDFVYLRATYGKAKTDNNFETNYKNARLSKIPVGAYHYLRFEQDGLQQALHFLKHTGSKEFELPPVLDVEEWGNHFFSNRRKVIEIINQFVTEVEFKTGRKVMIYTNENGYRKYIERNFAGQPLWICSFNNPPKISGEWVIWQHSHIGKMVGAEGWIDKNVFNGNESAWKKFLIKVRKK